ncbi:DinB family protein [Flavobacterium cellulosilyticum]|uniref:Damage-inducible protein DinB n=1 Tax=Flavobacterium cellulosilyticum TaxID=2541731 RepID=A0A4R5CM56_9FLAO|nr:DinB family protein [Flavobacterium cellulosilyticum]TDD98582.1 damage-inducible protein DinB [Flavobacterium cellulosilyticum]
MITKDLLGEFLHEVENTRNLLMAIPDSALNYKPSEISWTTGQLASHIAEVYNWYYNTIEDNVFDMATYKYDKGDISKASNIVAKFEENVKKAKTHLENLKEERLYENWSMKMGDKEIMAPMARIQVIRGFLMNHLYHHRGEMIVYLRATGNRVPGLYGPTYEESTIPQELESI